MPLTNQMTGHHLYGAETTVNLATNVGTVFAQGHIVAVAKVGVEVIQEKHRAALSLLGVTLESYRLTPTPMRSWVAVEFLTYGGNTPRDMFTQPMTSRQGTAVAAETTMVDTSSALANYVRSMCNPDGLTIEDDHTFRRIVERESELRHRRAVEEQMKLAYHNGVASQRDYQSMAKHMLGQYRTTGQIPDDMMDAMAAQQRYESNRLFDAPLRYDTQFKTTLKPPKSKPGR